MILILIIIGCLMLIIGLFFATKQIKPIQLNIISGIVIIIGTFFGLFGKFLQDKNSSEKSDKILNTTNEVYRKITGGDSYCVINVTFDEANNEPYFFLTLHGNTSLKNVNIKIEDYARRVYLVKKLANNDFYSPIGKKIVEETKYNFEIASLYPNTLSEIPIQIEDGQTNIIMGIWFFIDSGIIYEDIKIINFKSKNRVYSLVVKKDNKVILERN